MRLVGAVAGDVVAQADGGQRDEAVVEGVQEVPGGLQHRVDAGRHQHEEGDQRHQHQTQVQQLNVEGLQQEGSKTSRSVVGWHQHEEGDQRHQHQTQVQQLDVEGLQQEDVTVSGWVAPLI